MRKIVDACFTLLKFLIAACLAVMVVLVFGNVVLRYAFNGGITLSEEISRWLFVYLTFLGAIVAMRDRAHLGVDTLVKHLSPTGKKACLVASQLLMLLCCALLLQGSWKQTVINLGVTAPASGLSMGLFYGVGIVFSLSVGAILLVELYRVLAGKLSDDELVMVKESEEQEELEALQRELRARDEREARDAQSHTLATRPSA